ncbi:hypothetical protein RCL1_004265 [Eukaryota sp. TZLM3-RCL]
MTLSKDRIQRLQEILTREQDKSKLENKVPMKSLKRSKKPINITSQVQSETSSPVLSTTPVLPKLSEETGSDRTNTGLSVDTSMSQVLPPISNSPKSSRISSDPHMQLYDSIALYNKKLEEKERREKHEKTLKEQARIRTELDAQIKAKSPSKKPEQLESPPPCTIEKPAYQAPSFPNYLNELACTVKNQVELKQKERQEEMQNELQSLQQLNNSLKQEAERFRREKAQKVENYRCSLDEQLKEKTECTRKMNQEVDESKFFDKFLKSHENSLNSQKIQSGKYHKLQALVIPKHLESSDQSSARRNQWDKMSSTYKQELENELITRDCEILSAKLSARRELVRVLDEQVKNKEKLSKRSV